jgi:hypothetical protein
LQEEPAERDVAPEIGVGDAARIGDRDREQYQGRRIPQ